MRLADIAAVMQVQAACYAIEMNEAESVMAARAARVPDFAWVAEDAQGVCAYLLAYPSRLGRLTQLGADFAPLLQADCLYLHDLAVAPRAAGQALGARLVRHAWQFARRCGHRSSALVSVQDSRSFWERLGYAACVPHEAQELAKLSSYAQPCCYMSKTLEA